MAAKGSLEAIIEVAKKTTKQKKKAKKSGGKKKENLRKNDKMRNKRTEKPK